MKANKKKKEILKRLYTLDEICEILGYFDESNPDLDYPVLKLQEEFSPSTFEDMIFSEAIQNGNFEEVIKTGIRVTL